MTRDRLGFLAVVAVLAVALGASAAMAAETAESLWAARDNVAKAIEAAGRYQEAVAADPGDYRALVRLSRLHYWIGLNLAPVNEGEAVAHFEKGKAFAECAIAVDPVGAPAQLFKAANIAGLTTAEGTLKSLIRAGEVRSLAEKARARDRDYFFGGADRVLCAYYTDLPGILGGDLKKAIELGRRAVASHPEFAGNRVCLAEAYFKDGKNDLARRELELAIGTADNAIPDAVPEQRFEKGRAAALLKRIGK